MKSTSSRTAGSLGVCWALDELVQTARASCTVSVASSCTRSSGSVGGDGLSYRLATRGVGAVTPSVNTWHQVTTDWVASSEMMWPRPSPWRETAEVG
jgi:hypothetical protein